MRICPNYARSSAGERRISWLQFTRQRHPKWSEVQTMLQRMIGAAMFNSATYEEIEADRNALGEAILVVVLVTVCGIVGGIIDGLISGGGLGGLVRGIIVGLLFGIVRWALWVTVLNFVGGKMLRTSDTETNWSEIGPGPGVRLHPRRPVAAGIHPGRGSTFVVGRVRVDIGGGRGRRTSGSRPSTTPGGQLPRCCCQRSSDLFPGLSSWRFRTSSPVDFIAGVIATLRRFDSDSIVRASALVLLVWLLRDGRDLVW